MNKNIFVYKFYKYNLLHIKQNGDTILSGQWYVFTIVKAYTIMSHTQIIIHLEFIITLLNLSFV